MGQFFNSIKDISKNYKVYDDWEQQQDDILARKSYLIKQKPLDKFEKEALEKKAANVVRVSEIMDARSEDNAQNMEFLTQTAAGIGTAGVISLSQIGLLKYFDKKMRNVTDKSVEKMLMKRYFGTQLGMIFLGLALGIGFILWGNSKTKEASRLGRYQAKTRDLKDVKAFVQFTPEQIAQAEKIAETMPDEKQKKGLLQAIKNVREMSRDMPAYRAYKDKMKNNNPTPLQQNLSKEQLVQAEKDKELLLNVIKKINNTAEDYSENVENAFDTIQATSWLSAIPIGFGLNKLFKTMNLKIPKGKVSAGIAILFPLITSLWSLSAEKKAARVGRYIAKKEIMNNPELLRKFSDEDMKSVENIKAKPKPTGFFKKIAENFKFIPQYIKDKKAYDKYTKTERPKHEKLNKALMKVEVTDEQLKEAKHLQEKTFMSFDKIDEMSQRYSEDMEAAGEIGKNLVTTGFSLAGIGAMIGGCVLFFKGKLPFHRIMKFLSNTAFKKTSPIRQTVDEFYKILKNNKELKKAFNKLLSPVSQVEKAKAKEILMGSKEIMSFARSNQKAMEYIFANPMQISEYIKSGKLISHLNDNPVAKWARNLITEAGVIFVKRKVPYEHQKVAKQITDGCISKITGRKITNNYSRYKTLINTSIIAGIPVLGVLVGIPYAICSWLTNVQKKAGKIGVMKAIKELDNPNLYVNNDNSQQTKGSEGIKPEQKQLAKEEVVKSFLNK